MMTAERVEMGGQNVPPNSVRLLKLQHELVHWHLGLKHPLVARIFGVAEEIGVANDLETGRLDFAS
jgi:hypothetical protein